MIAYYVMSEGEGIVVGEGAEAKEWWGGSEGGGKEVKVKEWWWEGSEGEGVVEGRKWSGVTFVHVYFFDM